MYKVIVYVPEAAAEAVKNAIFATGAGSIGNYSHCSWETLGTGQFKPLQGANPTIGDVGNIEKVPELRIEILCEEDQVREALEAMRVAHPYEEPAFEVVSVLNHSFI